MKGWKNTQSNQYHEDNTHELYGQYGIYVSPSCANQEPLAKHVGVSVGKTVDLWWSVTARL